jgi:putative hydrolase of the HAD superfamily
MERARYDAAFFDVGNTLIAPHPSVSHVCEEILRAAGHVRDLASIESLMPLIDEYYEDRFRDDETFWTSEEATSEVWYGMYSLLCRRLGIEDQAEELAASVYREFGRAERWRPFDDVAPAFRRLQGNGIRVGIISNWDCRLEGLLDGLGLAGTIDTVVCSASVGLHKPDPRIFELACARLGAEPARCVHVGDHFYSDILGAKAAGLSAVMIDRRGTAFATSIPAIRSLDDLEGAW